MPYEDFHELFYQAYLQATTDEGQKQAEAEEFQEQVEESMGPHYGSMDMGLAIKNAVDNENRNHRR